MTRNASYDEWTAVDEQQVSFADGLFLYAFMIQFWLGSADGPRSAWPGASQGCLINHVWNSRQNFGLWLLVMIKKWKKQNKDKDVEET